ncbi:MAG: glycosyltransferase family 39 protein [Planctomycetota bacterium]
MADLQRWFARLRQQPACAWVAATALIVLLVAITYAPILGSFFNEIDDASHLFGVTAGVDPSPHFRPLHFCWNELLCQLFGARPTPFYLASMLLHAINATLVLVLVHGLVGKMLPAVVASSVFAGFYAPHQAVLWISASCGLLSMCFVLSACVAHVRYRAARRPRELLLCMLAAALAMASKEDAVILVPLVIAIDAALLGWRATIGRRVLLGHVPLMLTTLSFLIVTLHPSLWAARPDVGRYAIDASIVPKLLRSFAWLFWPRPAAASNGSTAIALVGLALLIGLALLGVVMRGERNLFLIGLVTAAAGFLPILPGPFLLVGNRYAYPSAIGAAIMIGAIAERLWSTARRWKRAALLLALFGFALVQVLAVHSIESWRYARRCARLFNLVQSTRAQLLGDSTEDAIVISPVIYNAQDYVHAVEVFLHWPPSQVSLESLPCDERVAERLAAGALDVAHHRVFACRGDGCLYRLHSVADAPLDSWRRLAREREQRGCGRTLAIARFAARATSSSAHS